MTTAVNTSADQSSVRSAGPRGRIGRTVAVSLATGLAAAALLVAVPLVPAVDSTVTGAVLCGFALGWAMLAVLSVRFTDQPQRWAAAPALLMGAGGLLLTAFGPSAQRVLDWVWPPVMLALAIWMTLHVRRRLPGPSRHWLLYPVFGMLALASLGGGLQTVGEAVDAAAHPMPGQLIDVGGHRLHLYCTGSGSPTVVLEPGGGGTSADLGLITPAVAHDSRVCVYDRAGHGWSEPGDGVADGTRIATDLHTLLHRAHVPGPYVLAGHSFGGLYVLTFAAQYPDEVAGMVLVDSTAPKWDARPAVRSPGGDSSNDIIGRVSALIASSARLGLGRATGATAGDVRSTIDEYVHANAAMEQAAALQDLAGKPLIVLTAGRGLDAASTTAQNHLATLSTNSAHRIIADASHADLVGDEHGAAATTQAILDVVAAVRSTAHGSEG
jgi:pimeloyl-ACP methyl ester carboxylesterase